MNFQASFIDDSVKISTEKGEYTASLGYITYNIATGSTGNIANFFSDEEIESNKGFASALLERCFSVKDSNKKLEAYFLCEDELKTGNGYSFSESRPAVMFDGSIGIVDTYWLNSLSSFMLLEMMYSIKNNIPIVKCPICSKFFIAKNNGILYCDNIYKDGKTCRQIGAKKHFTENIKSDELLLLYEKTYQSTYYKRSKTADPCEKAKLTERLSELKEARIKYKKGELSAREFASILEG